MFSLASVTTAQSGFYDARELTKGERTPIVKHKEKEREMNILLSLLIAFN